MTSLSVCFSGKVTHFYNYVFEKSAQGLYISGGDEQLPPPYIIFLYMCLWRLRPSFIYPSQDSWCHDSTERIWNMGKDIHILSFCIVISHSQEAARAHFKCQATQSMDCLLFCYLSPVDFLCHCPCSVRHDCRHFHYACFVLPFQKEYAPLFPYVFDGNLRQNDSDPLFHSDSSCCRKETEPHIAEFCRCRNSLYHYFFSLLCTWSWLLKSSSHLCKSRFLHRSLSKITIILRLFGH